MQDLIRFHNELRAILALAGKRIRPQSIGRKDDELLKKMRVVYRETRAIARRFKKGKRNLVADPGYSSSD